MDRQPGDRVILRRIPFNFVVAADAWNRDKPQPVYISLEIPHTLHDAATKDDVSLTLDYGKLYKLLTKELVGSFCSITPLVEELRRLLKTKYCHMEVSMPKANLRAEGGLHFAFDFKEGKVLNGINLSQTLSVRGIRCACIIGVNPHEREEKQIVMVNLDFKTIDEVEENEKNLEQFLSPNSEATIAGVAGRSRDMIQKVVEQVERSTYQTVEALATAIAKTVTVNFDIPGVWVEVEKPNAIAAIEAAGVRIYREKSFFTDTNFWRIRQP